MPDIQNDNQTINLPINSKNLLLNQQISPSIVQPSREEKLPIEIKYPPFYWSKSQKLIKEIEEKTKSKVLVYYMEPSSSIVNDDVDFFYSHVKELQSETPITLILVSSGGSGQAAWRIANVLKKYCNSLTVIVVSNCASAATLLSLSADKILFGPAGYLTAIDTTLNHTLNPRPTEKDKPSGISVDQINRIKNFINEDLKVHPSSKSLSEILFEKIHPVVIGELERTSSLSKLIARNMLELRSNQPTEDEKTKLIDILNDSYPTHGYPIVLKEAQKIGLPAEAISEELNQLSWELIKTYSLISKRIITNITQDFQHIENIPVLIESIGRRTFFSVSYDKRFKPTLDWTTENDKTKWLSAIPDPEFPEKCKISEIEL